MPVIVVGADQRVRASPILTGESGCSGSQLWLRPGMMNWQTRLTRLYTAHDRTRRHSPARKDPA